MDMRYLDKNFLTEFIELYQSFPCLWKVKSKSYTNKAQKNKAYGQMVTFCRQLFPDANRDWVAKKIQSIRGTFRKEMRKVKDKAALNELYSPQLWYFEHLLFLKDQDVEPDGGADAAQEFHFEDVGEESGATAEEEAVEPQYARIQDEDITDLRQQDRGFLTEFIEIYRSLPCLWKVKSKEYSNRHMKTRAYETLIKKFRQVDPNANRDTIVKKINSLRSCHRKELKKVNDSLLTGATEEDVHTPHLWYFDLLNFLRDQEQDVSSESMSIADEYMDEDSQEEKYVPRRFESLKRKASISEDNYLPLESCTLPVDRLSSEKTNLELNEYEAVGISVAKKLQRMDATQAIFAESLVHLVLRRGLLQSLTENTDLHDDFS